MNTKKTWQKPQIKSIETKHSKSGAKSFLAAGEGTTMVMTAGGMTLAAGVNS